MLLLGHKCCFLDKENQQTKKINKECNQHNFLDSIFYVFPVFNINPRNCLLLAAV